ncbi:GNAT family N-acetyltransferase [Vibrio sp. WXL210]|uniref:GNAT family N-acetyltransferase n=1 Tax=Vibrio sp. WXL210 TaxID=3450709 RepID=UPI003EC60EF3
MAIKLRPAKESDVDFLIGLRNQTMTGYLQDVGMPTSKEAFEERVRHAFEHAQIVEDDGLPIGLFKVEFTPENNHWFLVQIQIDPRYQGRNIGRYLIENLIETAQVTKATVGLGVIKTNPAQRLYTRLGFKVVGESQQEYLMQLVT